MTKHILAIICLGVFLALFIPETSLSDDLFSPPWKVGDTWVVKAVYPVPFEEDQWSKPVFWEYKVEGQENGPSGNCLVIAVRGKEKIDSGPALRLFYRASDHCLLRAESTKIRRGKKILKVLSYEGEYPVETQQSPVPFDSPVFPIRMPSSLAFSFSKVISGGLKRTETVRQEVRKVSGLTELKDLPEGYDQKELVEVRCEDVHGKALFSQYWDKALPWPVYGRNLNMKYWLMEK